MDWIIWDKTFELGHDSMDQDHKMLVILINLLADSMARRHGREFCSEVLDEIMSYTRRHFATEEQLMASRDYALADAHKSEHRSLLDLAMRHKTWFETGSLEASIALLDFLEATLARHILNSDKVLADSLAA